MTKTYDLYGAMGITIEQLRVELEPVLKVEFTERESDYRGGIYYRAENAACESFLILSNVDDDPEEMQNQITPR